MFPGERMVAAEVARRWWIPLVGGVIWLIIAWLVLRLNETSLTTVGVLMGVVFLFAALFQTTLATMAPGGWKLWHYLMAFIFALGAVWGFVTPINTFFALASVLGLILVLHGTFEIIQAVALRTVYPYWSYHLVSGILQILLAFWVSGSDRVFALQRRSYLILFWVGFFALFRGFSAITVAFGIRHLGKDASVASGTAKAA